MNKMPLKPPPRPEFLTHIPSRSYREGKWKFHRNLGHAKNAVIYAGYGKIYRWSESENDWVLLFDVPSRPQNGVYPWQE